MAMAGGRGVTLDPLPPELPRNALLFGEDQARYLIETGDPTRRPAAARKQAYAGPTHRQRSAAVALTLPGAGAISVAELKAANEAWLPGYMAQA